MRLTRQHQAYLAVLGLATAALVIDRSFLGSRFTGPADASAFTLDPDDPLHTPTPVARPTRTLASRIESAARANDHESGGVVNAFAPLNPEAAPASIAATHPAAAFLAAHRVTAVMVKPSGAAIIDGRCIRVGEEIDGYVLREVGQDQILLDRGGQALAVDVRIVPKAGDGVRVSSEKTAPGAGH